MTDMTLHAMSYLMLLLLLMMANLLFVGNPDWIRLLSLEWKHVNAQPSTMGSFMNGSPLSIICILPNWQQRESRRGAHNLPSRGEKSWRPFSVL